MPNAMNRFKPNQLIKVEKENENKDIKRRLKSIPKDKPACSKPETVWERLSKVKKCSSNEESVGSQQNRSRHTLQSKSSHRIPTVRLAGPIKKPLSPHTLANKRPERKLLKKSKLAKEHTKSAASCKQEKPVKEILTARSMSNSKSSSDENKAGSRMYTPRTVPTPCQFYSHSDDFEFLKLGHSTTSAMSQESFEQFEMAPLMPVPTRDSLNCSFNISKNFRGLLEQKQRTMAADEIKIVKDVVKTDGRHRQLQKDDAQLFKDILKTQLQEIIKQEFVVKSALNKLDSTMEVPTMTVVEKSVAFIEPQPQIPQVDVIFKNVPTLEKEIIILKALGEKLEATLKRTISKSNLNSISNTNNPDCPKIVTSTAVPTVATKINVDIATNTSALIDMNSVIATSTNAYTITKTDSTFNAAVRPVRDTNTLHEINFMMAGEHNALVRVQSTGIKQCKGLVHEYRIVQKTIFDLKKEASRHFYLPVNEDKTQLKRTSFRRLKEHPDVLMRHLKPKSSLVPFNVLDQDPMFFNSFLLNMNSTTTKKSTGLESYPVSQRTSRSSVSEHMVTMLEGGDSTIGARLPYYLQEKEPLKIEEIQYPHENTEICKELKQKVSYTVIVQPKVVLPEVIPKVELPKVALSEVVPPEIVTPTVVIPEKIPPSEGLKSSPSVVKVVVSKKFVKNRAKSEKRKPTPLPPPPPLAQAPIRGNQRRRIRRSITPMPEHKYVEPKNNLIKTILVGAVQISVFLILIMAITYPDVKC